MRHTATVMTVPETGLAGRRAEHSREELERREAQDDVGAPQRTENSHLFARAVNRDGGYAAALLDDTGSSLTVPLLIAGENNDYAPIPTCLNGRLDDPGWN
jgi:hypothetical protein